MIKKEGGAQQARVKNILLRMKLLTQSSQSGRPDQLHQLVVGHIAQQVLQAALPSEG